MLDLAFPGACCEAAASCCAAAGAAAIAAVWAAAAAAVPGKPSCPAKVSSLKGSRVVSRFPAFHFQVNQLKKRKMPCTWSKFVFLSGQLNVCFVRSRLVEKRKETASWSLIRKKANQKEKMKKTFSANLSCHPVCCLDLPCDWKF